MSYIKNLRDKIGNDKVILNACAVVIINQNNEILLQKRSDNLLWGLPGGLIELDESITEAAIREVKEETNLEIELIKFIGVFNNPFMRWREKDRARIISFAFLGKTLSSELKINDHESKELRYFSYVNLPQIHSMDTIEIIEAYYDKKFNVIEGNIYNGKEI
ncbi:MAG: NUDIX domain-containing protein [Candidatus Izimaplasma sp.]|nr:NUDIX domain-containing protein [Candidatus Izimaplasma bacterium]